MKLLLDTHVMLWWLRDNPRLGQEARSAIASSDNEVSVSIASFWELSIKTRTGKFDGPSPLLIRETIGEGFTIKQITSDHLAALEQLQSVAGHSDPFDHLILAQAIADGAILLTNDKAMSHYKIPCFPARR